jgi:hypothetical protein
VNIQFATDVNSRAIVGVDVIGEGNDHHLSEPMRKQVEQRSGRTVKEHLMDGGFLVKEEIETAASAGVTVYVPPKAPQDPEKKGNEYLPKPDESQTLGDWRQRMGSEQGKEIYKQRASTSETVNADLRIHRGLQRLLVRGLKKAKCVALWAAMAYNILHFGVALIA